MKKLRAMQLTLFDRRFRVRTAGCDVTVTAQTRSEARYVAFKIMSDTGLYRYEGGFFAFVAGGLSVKEVTQ